MSELIKKSKVEELDLSKVVQLVSEKGVLCRVLKGFKPRKPQQKMIGNVVDAYNKDAIALIEAGTGTGKSMAYLLPALFWALEHQQRTVISTHTIALQQQLIEKDIPQLTRALHLNIKAVLVKGMSNYLCLRKFDELKNEVLFLSPDEKIEFEQIEKWAETTQEGSKTTLPMVPSAPMWERLCAESDTCTNSKCSFYQKCLFFKARRQAEEAQIIVANHHLLFADLALRAETKNYKEPAVLPVYSRIVIDEAHHIEDIATDFFGVRVSRLGLLRTLGRIASDKVGKTQGRLAIIKEKAEATFLKGNFQDETSFFNRLNNDLYSFRIDLQKNIVDAFDAIGKFVALHTDSQDILQETAKKEVKLRFLQKQFQSSFWLDQIHPPVKRLIDSVRCYTQALDSLEKELAAVEHTQFQEQSKHPRQDVIAFARRLDEQADQLETLALQPPFNDKVRWIESTHSRSFNNVIIQDAELDVSKPMVQCLFEPFRTVILCSATLTTNQEFSFMRQRLGLVKALLPEKIITENIYDSPFNYKEQAMLVIPTDLPSPLHSDFLDKAVQEIWQTLQVTRGGAFILFTSYTMMQTCHQKLEEKLKAGGYNVFKQGDQERQLLLSRFRVEPRAVLFGTDSFWEGIDVAGEALRCVIIVKLPFKVPSEPIVQARTEAISARGGNAFSEYSLPLAIVKFKQGFGRLIRHTKDRGCIVCLDTRLLTKPYGQLFLNSLPQCQQGFASSEELPSLMREFYRKTHRLILEPI